MIWLRAALTAGEGLDGELEELDSDEVDVDELLSWRGDVAQRGVVPVAAHSGAGCWPQSAVLTVSVSVVICASTARSR